MHAVHPVAVLAPVLGRPGNARPLAESLAASTDLARLVFVCSPDDPTQIRACRRTGCDTIVATWPPGRADWSLKLELARACTSEPFLLLGSDDLVFHPGWADAVLDTFERRDVGLVGTNDLANPMVKRGQHSTHPVICRAYADAMGTIDDPSRMVPSAYWHNWVDNELVETAQARGEWAFARDAHVEHQHPIWRTAPDDATYARGQAEYHEDKRLFLERRGLWARDGRRRRRVA